MANTARVTQSIVLVGTLQTGVARVTQSIVLVGTLQTGVARVTQSIILIGVGLGINCGGPPVGIPGTPYSHAFPSGGGQPPLVFSIIGGALPLGLSLNPLTGIVSGVPLGSGVFSFTVQVTDALFAVASVICSIAIVAPVNLQGLRVILRGVKRTRKGQEPELCGCPESPHVKRAV